jgi:hypothetical protein
MTNLLTWEAGNYNSYVGLAGGVRLFSITWKTRREAPDWKLRADLTGIAGREWEHDDREFLQARAEEALAAWLARVTGPPAAAEEEKDLEGLSGVRRGDTVWVFSSDRRARNYQQEVTAAGPKWITVGGSRYDREFGTIADGAGGWRIETEAGHVARLEREALTAVLHDWDWHPSLGRRAMTLAQLREAAAMLKRWAAA